MKQKISFFNGVRRFTNEEMQQYRIQLSIRKELGLSDDIDSQNTQDIIPSNYKSSIDYNNDILQANILITSNQPIPQDLYDRLVTAKQDLIKRGLYEE